MDEGLKVGRQLLASLRPQRFLLGRLADGVGHLAPGGVLDAQHLGQVDELPGFLELGEDEVLFQLLVIPLDEPVNDVRGAGDHVDHRRVARRQPAGSPPRRRAGSAGARRARASDPPSEGRRHPHATLGLGVSGRERDQHGARAGHARQELPSPVAPITHGEKYRHGYTAGDARAAVEPRD